MVQPLAGPIVPSPFKTKSREIIQPTKIQVISNLLEKRHGFEYTDNGAVNTAMRVVP
jgi:hypothetical protein